MKIIHTADIHLNSSLTTHLDGDKNKIRKSELLQSFKNLIDYANYNNVSAVIIAGDLFDVNKITNVTKKYVLDLIKQNSHILFFYVYGNHDKDVNIFKEDNIKNLIVFEEFKTYELQNGVTISGVSLNNFNKYFYNQINLSKEKANIFIIHGDIFASKNNPEFVDLKSLQNKNINYLALGHLHSFQEGELDKGGVYVYPGCLEGRGFDETGEKGFVLIEVENNKLNYKFIKNSIRTFHKVNVDITGLDSYLKQEKAITNAVGNIPKEHLVEIVLTGYVNLNQNIDIMHLLSVFDKKFFYVKITNKTRFKVNYSEFENDISLIGEFVKVVFSSYEEESKKEQIVNIGLKALRGEEV